MANVAGSERSRFEHYPEHMSVTYEVLTYLVSDKFRTLSINDRTLAMYSLHFLPIY